MAIDHDAARLPGASMMAIWRRLLLSFPEHLRGALDYYFRPAFADAFGPFNGQVLRQHIFRRLTEIANVTRIVETGTYRGTTTMFSRSSVCQL